MCACVVVFTLCPGLVCVHLSPLGLCLQRLSCSACTCACVDSERKKKPLQAACTLKPAQKDWAVLSAVFQRADGNEHVIVAQGGAARPMFRVTAITDEEHQLIADIELPAFTDGHGLIVPEVAAAKSGAPVRAAPQSISVLGPAQQLTLRYVETGCFCFSKACYGHVSCWIS